MSRHKEKAVTKIARFFYLGAVAFYIYHFLFFWIFMTVDSHFYWLLAVFFKTGKYSVPAPYYYQVPSTMEPPLYSVILYFAQFFQRPDIVIHFLQILGLIISSLFLYQILKTYLPKGLSFITSAFFLLLPANIIYASNLMAESLTLPFVSFYLFISFLIIVRRKKELVKFLMLISAVMMLQKYNLIIFWFLSLGMFILMKKKKIIDYFYAFLSFVII